jgi:hypothetical protein
VSERLAISIAHVSKLEGDLWATNSLLEASVATVMKLEAALESTQKLLEATHMEGKHASEAQLKLVL